MARFQSLPQELFDSVFQHCSRDDLRACHLTSRALSGAVRPQLFRVLHLSLDSRSWDKAQLILADKTLCSSVQELVLHPCLLPIFPDKEAWLLCVDVRPFRGKFYYDILDPKQRKDWMDAGFKQDQWLREAYDSMPRWPENVHSVYEGYLTALKNQKQFIAESDFPETFRKLVQSFPRLQKLRDVPWYEDWFEPPFIQKDGTLDETSWYLDMLKPKDYVLFKSEDLEEVWDETDVFRSSILRARTIASRLFVHAITVLDEGSANNNRVRELDMSISLDGLYAELRANKPEGGTGEVVEYLQVMSSCLHSFNTCNISSLAQLKLSVVNGLAENELEDLLQSLRKLLDTAESLARFSFSIRTSVSEYDFLEIICKSYMPNLATFDLSGASTSAQSLTAFLRNHVSTLKTLSLHEVYLPFGAGTWSRLLMSLPKILSLQNLDASCLIDNGEHHGRGAGFIGPDRSSLPGVQAYVCSGGPWLGLTSVMEESAWGKAELDKQGDSQGDSGWDWSGPSWSARQPFASSSPTTSGQGWYKEVFSV